MPRARHAAIAVAASALAALALSAHADPGTSPAPPSTANAPGASASSAPSASPSNAPSASPSSAPSAAPGAPPPYPLDSISRSVPDTGAFLCPNVEIESHRGDIVRFKPPAWVYPGFRPRLVALERVARDVGIEVYGRAPERIVELGGYGCRRMRDHNSWLSEHALGNAIDVEGFDFGHAPKGMKLPAGMDKSFANGFEVRVLRHWGKTSGHAAVHARFLRTFIERLAAREDAFRVLLGPGYPGHNNHFHFDMAPFRLMQVVENGRAVAPQPRQAP